MLVNELVDELVDESHGWGFSMEESSSMVVLSLIYFEQKTNLWEFNAEIPS